MITESLITVAATQMIKSFVDELFVPKFKKFLKTAKIENAKLLNRNKGFFNEYLLRTYEKYSIINTLVFHNSQRKLKEIYVAQSLVKESHFIDYLIDNNKNNDIVKIDQFPKELINNYKKILITDSAGMGKSTIMKRMFIDLIDNGLKDVGIPIYIELNRLNKDHLILSEIQEELNSLSEEFDSDLLLNFIQTGGFIFFFDGYDEISIADKIEVTKDIQSFISKAGTSNYYILTSRPEDSLASFGDFRSFKIQPLSKEDAFKLLDKYDLSNNKMMSKKLITLLKSGKYNSIDEYLGNPLLVSLLYAGFDHKQIIPLKKHLFYRQVYEAFFDTHDLSKGIGGHKKRSGLDIDDFSRVLKCVGYICLKKTGIKFDEETILKVIDNAKTYCVNLDFKKYDFLKDLLTSVPLFCKDGNEYKWVHKSLMEYFAARFIADDTSENKDKYLKDIYRDKSVSKYENMLDLYYDIDYKGFSKSIMLPYLEEFVEYYDEHYPQETSISSDLIEARLGLSYRFHRALIKKEKLIENKKSNNNVFSYYYQIKNKNEFILQEDFIKLTETSQGGIFSLMGTGSYRGFQIDVIYDSDRYYILKKLLFEKVTNLFHQYKIGSVKIDDILYKEEEYIEIEVMAGNDDVNEFVLINNLLARITPMSYNYIFNYMGEYHYLDYKAVKNEIEKIKKEIVETEESDLFKGL